MQGLTPSSQDISAFYLAKIYQILAADSSGLQVLIPPTLSDPSIPFSPPTSIVWVNSLWFLSLVISLTCALLATLLQQWARRYMKLIQTRYSPHKRARIRAFFAEGVDNLCLPWAVEALPALLHLSLFLFFAGLAVFLFNINHTVFNVTISWIGLCTSMYMCITFMPMFRHDSPYYAPLSSLAWHLYTGIRFTLFQILWWIADRCNFRHSIRQRARNLRRTYWQRTLRGMEKEFEETALKAPAEIDGRALMWTYKSLDEDHELEQFFASIPGFCGSNVVEDPQYGLDCLRSPTVAEAFNGFLERTWSSNLLSETIKIRRLAICIRAIDAAHLSNAAYEILYDFFEHWPALLRSIELGHALIGWGNNDDQKAGLFAQGIISCIIANVPQRNPRWSLLAMRQLGISEHVLQDYLHHGDSVFLANLTHFTRQLVRNLLNSNWEKFPLSRILSRLGSNYNVQNTLPGLQHDFCSLWNEVVLLRRGSGHHLLLNILEVIRPTYIALHQYSTPYDLDQLCRIPSHHMGSVVNLNDVECGKTAVTDLASITASPSLPHRCAVSVIPPLTEHDGPPSPTSNLDHAIPHPVVEQSRNAVLDDVVPVGSSIYLTPLENDRICDGTPADPIQGITDLSSITSIVNTSSRCNSNHGTASRTTSPSFVPDAVPSPIPVVTVSPNHTAPHVSNDPTVNQSGRSPDDGLISPSSSRILTPFQVPLASRVITGFSSNAAPKFGPLDTPDDTQDPNRRVVSQSPSPSDITADSPQPEDHDESI